MYHDANSDMASKVPYYYSELKKGTIPETEKNNLNKIENPYEKGHGFDNPLLAIEPDINTCELPEKVTTFQKKKKKKKNLATPVYRRSNSLITNSLRMSPRTNYARKEVVSAGEGTTSIPQKNAEQCHKRRSSEPNIYEEIPEQAHDDSCYSGSVKGFAVTSRWPPGSRKRESDRSSLYSSKVVLDEVEKVQQRHAQILENLNLDVEAMLMPEDTACSDDLRSEASKSVEHHCANADLKTSHILSPGTPPLYFATSRWQGGGGGGTLPKPATASLGRRVMNEYILQQSDFCPGSKTTGGHGQKSLQTPEDNIYEEVDLQQINQTDEDFGETVSWIDSEIGVDHSASSASEEIEEESGASKLAARFIGKKKKNSKKGKENEGITGGFTRWFSTRKKEYELDKCVNKVNRHSQDEEGYVDVKIPKKQRPPLSLPPIPANLSPEKMKRRYIVGSIVDSENSYLNSLQRLIRDYKHPLEDSTQPIVSSNKISIMFHRVEQILQCHNIFGIALTQCVRQWDQDEKIGDVFVASFSKTMVLDIYSDFINNFSLSMETAKQASKNKSAFADFLKVKQINSPDRLSFFGLMVKPVQRFPQFILMLQDLLKDTPPGHHDRMSLQMALTQLESLAETLNERKREAEQHHAVREVLKHLGKFSLKSSMDRDHYLLRQDDVVQLHLDQSGIVIKSKNRRLFLLNDLLVSVAVTPRSTDGIQNGERLNLKWAVPLQEVEVHDDVALSTKNLIFSGRHKSFGRPSLECHSDISTDRTLYDELSDLVHDSEVTSRITALVSSMRRSYSGLGLDVVQSISHSIQESIRQKCEEIRLLDSCCLQLAVPLKSKSNKENVCLQMTNPSVKRDWTTDLRLAKLALDPNNTPAWDIPEQEKRPSSKMPLFVKTFPVFQSTSSAEVKCGCHYIVNSSAVPQQYLWLSSTDGINSHLVVMAVHLTHLRQVAVYHLSELIIIAIEAVPVMQFTKGCTDPEDTTGSDLKCLQSVETVWMGTDSKKILVLEGSCPEKWEEIGTTVVPANVMQIKYHWDQVYVALNNGSVIIFHRDAEGQFQLQDPTVVTLDQEPVTCLLPLGLTMYCACGSKIWIVDALTTEVQRSYAVQHEIEGQAYLLAHSGTGLWIALKNSATICLYHTETFRHLQDINIAANVNRVLAAKDKDRSPHMIFVTSLLASKGLLWVGTNVGIILTVPLPRLEGVPIITGRLSLAFHAHQGPVQFLLSLQPKAMSLPVFSSPITRRPASADGDDESLALSPRARVVKQISDSVLPSPVSNKKFFSQRQNVGDIHASGVKTLPRGITFCPHVSPQESIEESNDVYGLYADLMNVQDYEKDSQEKLYERLNHSDPELVNFHLSTLDRRVQQKSGRPRSWDLSTMAVSEDSDSSAAYDAASTATSTTATEISMTSPESTLGDACSSPVRQIDDESRSPPTHVTLGRTVCKSIQKNVTDSTQKTVLMLTGGCGYSSLRKVEKEQDSKSSLDAHVLIWEVKL